MDILYILMRNDLESLNPGKACAQAAHAANQFRHFVETNKTMLARTKEWEGESDCGFGTTIVLSMSLGKINQIFGDITKIECDNGASSVFCGKVLDETYPVPDGKVIHLLPVETCAFIFGDKDGVAGIITRGLSLMG